MKKLIAIFAVAAVMASCTNGEEVKSTEAPKDSLTVSPSADATKTLDSVTKALEAAKDTGSKMMEAAKDTVNKMIDKAQDKVKDASKMVDKAKEEVKH